MNSAFGVANAISGIGIQGIRVVNPGSGYPATGTINFSGTCSTMPTATFYSTGGQIIGVNMGSSGINLAGSFTGFGNGCIASTMSAVADTSGGGSGASLRVEYGLTPKYNWSGNAGVCTFFNGSNMNTSQCSSYTNPGVLMPSGDFYPTAVSGLMTDRFTNVGLKNYGSNDFNCYATSQSGCGFGVNVNKLEGDLGIVSQISSNVSGTTLAVSYLAPDSRSCYVDITTNGGTSWTRTQDSNPGVRSYRTVSFTGLGTGVSGTYRILCYFNQTEGYNYNENGDTTGWFRFPSEYSNIQTVGSFTTLSSTVSRVTENYFTFPSGVSNVTLTYTPVSGGSSYFNGCTSSPCAVTVPVGDYNVTYGWSNGTSSKNMSFVR